MQNVVTAWAPLPSFAPQSRSLHSWVQSMAAGIPESSSATQNTKRKRLMYCEKPPVTHEGLPFPTA